jgi:hypothetical protein
LLRGRCGAHRKRRCCPTGKSRGPQGTSLTQIADDVWLAERPFYPRLPGLQGTDVACKAAIVRLPDGKLWVHAPVGLDAQLRDALAELGPIGHLVTPNTEHQKFAPSWFIEYPEAVSWACPGLREKKPDVGWRRSLTELLDAPNGLTARAPPEAWGGALDLCWIRDKIPLTPGIAFFNEVVFCHRPSKTLIVTDLWWNYPRTVTTSVTTSVTTTVTTSVTTSGGTTRGRATTSRRRCRRCRSPRACGR